MRRRRSVEQIRLGAGICGYGAAPWLTSKRQADRSASIVICGNSDCACFATEPWQNSRRFLARCCRAVHRVAAEPAAQPLDGATYLASVPDASAHHSSSFSQFSTEAPWGRCTAQRRSLHNSCAKF